MKTATMMPPLSPADILTLRGKPAAKRIVNPKQQEEWIYYSSLKPSFGKSNRMVSPEIIFCETYFFRNSYLVGWTKKRV